MTNLTNSKELLDELLVGRGIKTEKEKKDFLNPDYDLHNHDPFLLKDMDKTVSRILSAIDKNEKIIIFSDYDADGIPGGVILHDFFKKIGFLNFSNYMPHRHNEGFGLNSTAIENFAKDKVDLVITIDCGIADAVEIEKANKLGLDVIITDHHEPTGTWPKAFAIIDPKQPGCKYPFKHLCGSGVIFKVIQAILIKKDFGLKKGTEKWFLDMVGIATLSDMVPLIGENRVFASYGLKVLRISPRKGLLKLFRKLKIDQKNINEDDIGFVISPRINAASRMGKPEDAFLLLSTTDEVEAGVLADHLDTINNERKGTVASMVKKAKSILKKRGKEIDSPVIVIGHSEWKPALLGLLANSLAEEYKKPIFVWGRDGFSTIKGSCRSDGKTDLMKLMEKVKDSLLQFGGHKFAGGFSVSHEEVYKLEEKLSNAFVVSKNDFEENTLFDKKMSLDDVNWDTWKVLEVLAPFGVGNNKPIFMFENISVENIKLFGKENNHIELMFKNSSNKILKAIAFFKKQDAFGVILQKGIKINLLAHIEKSVFRGFPELRLRIVEITA